MSDRQTPNFNMHTHPLAGRAARGAIQCRDDQPAGVDNSQQAAQGCRVAAGATGRRADTCTLGTADLTTSEKLRQIRLLALWGMSEEDIAAVMGVSLEELACTAWESDELLSALSPSPEERDAYLLKKAQASAKRAASRKEEASSPSARIRNSMRARLWAALKGRTDGALFSRLGYSAEELVAHLQAQFTAGMSWDNYGAWHVDHILPCAMFDQTDPEQFRSCWALSNLQPLWAADNLRKGARVWEN